MRNKNWKTHIILSLFILLLCSYQIQATNGMFPIATSPKAGGRGGVGIGLTTDASAITTNPAGIAFIPGKMVSMSVGGILPYIRFKNAYNRNALADRVPVALGSMSMVWDYPSQTFAVIADPIDYTFGGEPTPSSTYSAIGDGTLAYTNAKAFSLKVSGKSATISNIRIYGDISGGDEGLIWQTEIYPRVLPHARLASVRVRFEGNSIKEAAKLILSIENKKVEFALSAKKRACYFASAWGEKYSPTFVKLTSKGKCDLENVHIMIGYRYGDRYIWKTAYYNPGKTNIQKNSTQKALVATNDQKYVIDGQKDIALTPIAQVKAQNLHIHYHYCLDKKYGAHLKAQTPTGENTHLLPAREQDPRGNLHSNNQADFEVPHPKSESGFKFGMAIFPQAGATYTMDVVTDLFPNGIENYTDVKFVTVAPTIAFRFKDRFSIGVSFHANFMSSEMDGLIAQNASIMKGSPFPGRDLTFGEILQVDKGIESIRGEVDTEALYGYGFGGKVGIMWKITDRLQIGAVYSPKTFMQKAEGKAIVDFTNHFNQINDLMSKLVLPNNGSYGFRGKYDAEMEFDIPQYAGVGVSYRVRDNLVIAVDFRWIDYSDTQKEIKLDLDGGSNVDVNALAGSSDLSAVLTVGWKDQYVIACGVVWQPFQRWILRAGYNYSNNPVKEKYLSPQLAAISEHHVTLGASWLVNRHFMLDFSIEAAVPKILNSDEENEVSPDYADSKLELCAIGVIVGMSWNF